MVDAAGGAPRQLTNWQGFEYSPVWSGDGTAVYFQADRDTKLGDVWKVAVSGGEPVRVTNNGTMGSSSLVSRAGVSDLFGGTINPSRGQLGFSRVRPDGRMTVVWDRTNAYPVAISPSGDSVAAMVEQPSGKMQLMILPAAGGTGRTILGADERARERAADLNDVPAGRPRVEHRVERDDVLDVGGRAADDLGHVAHRVARQMALLRLRQVQRRQNRRLALLGRIPRADLVQPRAVLRRVHERRPVLRQRARGLMMPAAVVHRWMKTHDRDL